MKITKSQLKRIIKENLEISTKPPAGASTGKTKVPLMIGEEDMSTSVTAPNNEHHMPRVDWTNIGELTDKWADAEYKAFDKGDPSMMAMGDTLTDAKKAWELQVDDAALDMENELTQRIRQLALATMQEFTEKLINGDYS